MNIPTICQTTIKTNAKTKRESNEVSMRYFSLFFGNVKYGVLPIRINSHIFSLKPEAASVLVVLDPLFPQTLVFCDISQERT
jgi:hypothetical protein